MLIFLVQPGKVNNMRAVRRDLKTIYYSLYLGETDEVDDGLYTGDKIKSYGDPVEMKINLGVARGSTVIEMFGNDIPYDRTLITHDLDCPINENSLIWIDKTPTDGDFNYIVQKVAKGLNNITYAVRRVDIS